MSTVQASVPPAPGGGSGEPQPDLGGLPAGVLAQVQRCLSELVHEGGTISLHQAAQLLGALSPNRHWRAVFFDQVGSWGYGIAAAPPAAAAVLHLLPLLLLPLLRCTCCCCTGTVRAARACRLVLAAAAQPTAHNSMPAAPASLEVDGCQGGLLRHAARISRLWSRPPPRRLAAPRHACPPQVRCRVALNSSNEVRLLASTGPPCSEVHFPALVAGDADAECSPALTMRARYRGTLGWPPKTAAVVAARKLAAAVRRLLFLFQNTNRCKTVQYSTVQLSSPTFVQRSGGTLRALRLLNITLPPPPPCTTPYLQLFLLSPPFSSAASPLPPPFFPGHSCAGPCGSLAEHKQV